VSELLQETAGFIKNGLNIKSNESILLAVSGGIDSMVMCDILSKLNLNLAIAHCNFSLRGEESDGDEAFVKEFALNSNIKIFSKRFNTKRFGKSNGLSIQMAARKLRYDWFEDLRQEEGFDYIAVAHNSDDVNETFFINLARGTGLKGLSGIKAQTGNIIRPLLFASRRKIEQYATEYGVKYREDSSNSSIEYKRNRLRHNILPEFQYLNPSFSETMESTIGRLNETYGILEEYIRSVKKRLFTAGDTATTVSVNELAKLSPANTWLFELFKEYSVNHMQINEIKKLLYAESGRKLLTSSHIIVKDRGELVISENMELHKEIIVINSLEELLAFNGFVCDIIKIDDSEIIKDSAIACLDFDRLEFPLTIRSWHDGDWFFPLGMKGKKKISDFFTDCKIRNNLKSTIKLLISLNDICWVAGYRIDNRFRIKPETRTVLVIRVSPDL